MGKMNIFIKITVIEKNYSYSYEKKNEQIQFLIFIISSLTNQNYKIINDSTNRSRY